MGAVRTLFRAAGGEDRQGLRAGYSDRQGKTALVGTYIGVPICSPVCGEWSSTSTVDGACTTSQASTQSSRPTPRSDPGGVSVLGNRAVVCRIRRHTPYGVRG